MIRNTLKRVLSAFWSAVFAFASRTPGFMMLKRKIALLKPKQAQFFLMAGYTAQSAPAGYWVVPSVLISIFFFFFGLTQLWRKSHASLEQYMWTDGPWRACTHSSCQTSHCPRCVERMNISSIYTDGWCNNKIWLINELKTQKLLKIPKFCCSKTKLWGRMFI